jgi:aspartyl-tRNA(Asn)/glutamyl-tRNA(Gln) amidotransferase subunit C
VSISEKDVRHVAKLAALELADGDVEKTHRELSDILQYVEQLQKISTNGVPPTSHVHGVINAFRDDIIKDSISLQEIEKIAPDFTQGFFRVPKIIG